MVSFYLKGDYEETKKVVARLKLFLLAESLGGVESLINHPELMTHASVPPELRKTLGITPNLLRLSCGIENGPDLVNDLAQALDF
jgi:cystathionine beta-lyase/cystathionine gamma-synthase